jgi:hypothetical protein
MNEYRRQILDMLAAGRISAAEADRLLSALDGVRSSSTAGGTSPDARFPEDRPKSKAKYLRVLVESSNGAKGEGLSTVNVRVPMQLLRAGVRLASLIPPQAHEHLNDALREHGVPLSVSQIKPENLEDLIDHLNDLTVDIDDSNAKVKVFCE